MSRSKIKKFFPQSKCHYCKKRKGDTIDHIIPKSSVDGFCDFVYSPDNYVPSCKICNQNKADLSYDLFVRFIKIYEVPKKEWFGGTNKNIVRQMKLYTMLHFDPEFTSSKKGNQDTYWYNVIKRNSEKRNKKTNIIAMRVLNKVNKELSNER